MGASSQPEYPFPGGTPGTLPPDPQPGKPGHFAFTRWIREFARRLDAESVKRSGDTMTGALTVLAPTAAKHPATKEYVDLAASSGVPIGTIVAYGGTSAPANWQLCDGTAHGSSALQAVLGSPNVPDLRNRFIVGAGSAYARGNVGGVDLVTLTANQSGLRDHGHVVDPPGAGTNEAGGSHQHGGATASMNRNWSHGHAAGWWEGTPQSNDDGDVIDSTGPSQNYVRWAIQVQATDTNHEHGFETDWRSTNHAHSVDIPAFWSNNCGAANATEAHENRPPYYALVYIIKKA
jgi:microcystin-dependent protein